MKENEILDKALGIIDEALSGRVIDPNALQTAISMTQLMWTSVYSERVKQDQMRAALRETWEQEIKDN